MDLNWCIICDNRIEDDELSMVDVNTSLYCSQDCKIKDDDQKQPKSITTTNLFCNIPNNNMKCKKPITIKHKPTPMTYPWIPLYRKRRIHSLKRSCQATVAGSPTNATALLSSH